MLFSDVPQSKSFTHILNMHIDFAIKCVIFRKDIEFFYQQIVCIMRITVGITLSRLFSFYFCLLTIIHSYPLNKCDPQVPDQIFSLLI